MLGMVGFLRIIYCKFTRELASEKIWKSRFDRYITMCIVSPLYGTRVYMYKDCENGIVAAMRIQVTEAMFSALTTAHLGYMLKHRGEVEVKVRRGDKFLQQQQRCGIMTVNNYFIVSLENTCWCQCATDWLFFALLTHFHWNATAMPSTFF